MKVNVKVKVGVELELEAEEVELEDGSSIGSTEGRRSESESE